VGKLRSLSRARQLGEVDQLDGVTAIQKRFVIAHAARINVDTGITGLLNLR